MGLRINPKVMFNDKGEVMWRLDGACDSTWGSNEEDSRSVTWCVLHFMGVLVAWKSKSQPNVSLSSSEAECVSISELVKETSFALKILEDVCIKVEPPVKIFVDNMGAINMVRNNAVCNGTRHVNVRCHFVRELHKKVVMMHCRESGKMRQT